MLDTYPPWTMVEDEQSFINYFYFIFIKKRENRILMPQEIFYF